MRKTLAFFEGRKIRRFWDKEQEKWYFSIIDVVEVLTGSTIPRRYWSDLKIKLNKEGSEVYEKIVQLKMQASDEKYYFLSKYFSCKALLESKSLRHLK